ncbi:HAMP domain-containing protein [Virgibacillus sp. MSP4-1]|uniref:methyl-accepting chemotaxis protein n=1 Tax=Virgibacillus sp. MSP4-1 TaxID=2700081 RepID=UPI0003A84E5D|nr:methyl-accepting chemotaxis protein [Virgibacillus sp. MSP4-1]QHS23447.1 HAMP domain-containing protein [Virgibacillus sp. MSP4-1]
MFGKLKLKNLNIGWKFGVSLIIVFILFGAATGIVSALINSIGDDIAALERRGDRSVNVTEMGSLTRSKGIRVVAYAQKPDEKFLEEYQTRREKFNTLEAKIKKKMDTEEQLDLFNQIVENDKKMNDLFTKDIVKAVQNDNTRELDALVSQANSIRSETVDLLESLRTIVNEERSMAVNQAKESQQLTLTVLIASMAFAIVIGGLLVFFISRVVSRNLNKVVEVSNAVADGNLQIEAIEYDGKDEIGELADATNTMGKNLKQVLEQISEISETVSSQSEELTQSSNEVKTGSEQISSTMQELASGSESQANHASDLSSKMGDFTGKVQEANGNGEEAYSSSNEVLNLTGEGSELMESSVQQMSRIDEIVKGAVEKVQGLDNQSQEISKLVSVIKDIADQTNLLALNAAIEAARAGEHGQGFAVVADEVRKLAEQVAESVNDITGIVGNIQNESSGVVESLQNGYSEVEKGTSQIKTTGETFGKINDAVNEMVDNIQNVTTNLSDIAENSEQMNTSIQEIASVSEESAAGVEQASASAQQSSTSMEEVAQSSDELAKLAEQLNNLVRQFKL